MITRPYSTSGLGCNLLSMIGALYLCERTQRNLIVDWTSMSELRDRDRNYFVTFFEPIRRWREVEITYVNGTDAGSSAPRYDPAASLQPSSDDLRQLIAGKHESRNVFLQPFHYHIFKQSGLSEVEIFRYTREFYRLLIPKPFVRERLASHQSLFENRLVIGLNLRTGNGQFAPGSQYEGRVKMSIFQRKDFLGRVNAACDDCCVSTPMWLAQERAIYVVTDCQEMQDALLTLPRAFAVRSRFPPPGVGHQFAAFETDDGYSDVDSVTETLVDMLLLARCHGLVCNYTEYNRYAQYISMFFNGNVRNIEHYFDSPVRRLGRRVKRHIAAWRS